MGNTLGQWAFCQLFGQSPSMMTAAKALFDGVAAICHILCLYDSCNYQRMSHAKKNRLPAFH
jgi:adenosylmethionine-8-amino-7-oxononanoate aminotransferase